MRMRSRPWTPASGLHFSDSESAGRKVCSNLISRLQPSAQIRPLQTPGRGLRPLMKPFSVKCGLLGALALSVAIAPAASIAQTAGSMQTEKTAQSAYIYGFPIVDMYRIMFGYNIDTTSPAYAAPFNVLHNTANVYTPADTTVQTPNSDTPYSTVGLDLRAEPLVLTLPAIESSRYYSVQIHRSIHL